MTEFNIDIRFETSVEQSPRVIEVAEAFGIGLGTTEFVIYDNLELNVQQGDVIYITGQSGSGKSLLLRELARRLEPDHQVAYLDDVHLEDAPIIEQFGDTMSEASRLLGQTGISDANLYIRKPSELSDGQRYRARLAKVLESGADVWVADEFGAVLDRTTAKNVAINVSKAARKASATLIVATTHTDLVDELAPTLTVIKRYRDRIEVKGDGQ